MVAVAVDPGRRDQALRSPRAAELGEALRGRGVLRDHRGDTLRLGPAPYLSDRQLRDAIDRLGECLRAMDRKRKG
jgi:kynureninase